MRVGRNLPGATLAMKRQPQERQHSIVDLVFIDIHVLNSPLAATKILRPTSDAYRRHAEGFVDCSLPVPSGRLPEPYSLQRRRILKIGQMVDVAYGRTDCEICRANSI